ncbi:MAG: cobalt-precorrin-5B (C(1))-methyltransferase [Pseudomonadota bacterium]
MDGEPKRKPDQPLRSGFTTGACATAGVTAAYAALLTGEFIDPVRICLPKGQTPEFPLEDKAQGQGWARAAVRKDAGDDPDVTHRAVIVSTVRLAQPGAGVVFKAGEGVGAVTKPGLPIPPGEPAINPVPRQMMRNAVARLAAEHDAAGDVEIEISVPNGRALAQKTWNPRLGIEGGISILGTTGIVRPFSCAAWIASIHRGIDVARANGARHVAGSTGATSERIAQAHFGLPDWAMLDMGDFAGGMLKYLRAHPVDRLTIAGGFGKLTKLSQGALDLHSGRSQVDFERLAATAAALGFDPTPVRDANTAKQALELTGEALAEAVAAAARDTASKVLQDAPVAVDVLVVSRDGRILAHCA